jgi:hypothetical protein
MSYSSYVNCGNCRFKDDCTDREKLQDAIDTIHSEPNQPETGKGHFGGGMIILNCHNHDQPCAEPADGQG